jgi:hypothetical protein
MTVRRVSAPVPRSGDETDLDQERGVPSDIKIRLDELLLARGMTLTELSERVGITLVNLSVLKTGRRGQSGSAPWTRCAPSSAANPATCSVMSQARALPEVRRAP